MRLLQNIRDIIVKGVYYKRLVRNRGIYIMQEDWDNLIILDACRYDMFEKLNNISGERGYRLSRGSCTNEFLIENFGGRKFDDTVYVTANPLVDYHVSGSFAKLIPVWKDGWYEEYGTVLPQTVVEYAIQANEMYPRKRLIVHFMQPHYPFIGKRSREKVGAHEGILSRNLVLGGSEVEHKARLIWNLLKEGKLNRNTAWEAYEENLQIVLKYVRRLIEVLVGKTVITSDHGNLFGERIPPLFMKEYGHPSGVYTEGLIKVPWFVIENGERKIIEKSGEVEGKDPFLDDLDREKVGERLRALGYFD